MLAMSMDLVSWLLLLLSVVCCWKALGVLVREYTFTPRMARLLTLGGWLGGACLLLAVLSRPVNSYLITWHLPAAEQVFKWNFYPQDVMSAMLCGSLLCLGYIIAWAQEIAEENRGFV